MSETVRQPRRACPDRITKPISFALAAIFALAAAFALLASCDRAGVPVKHEARDDHRTLLIAPHIQGESFCPQAAADPKITDGDVAAEMCARARSNAARRISATLEAIGPALSPSGHYALGYVLTLPLMRYARHGPHGWTVDAAELANDLTLVRDIDRPVVIYLSLNHFTDAGVAASRSLAKSPQNLMWTRAGPLQTKDYFRVPVIAWTLADRDAPVTKLGRQLFSAAVDAICSLDDKEKNRIAAVSLLGEVHQLFPDLAAGPGYGGFDVTDYSPASIAGFRRWLAARYATIGAFDQAVGGRFSSFNDVTPPDRDALASGGEPLAHIDASAAGHLAIYGWAYDPTGVAPQITLYVDGVRRATTLADLNRTDVPEADKTVTTPNVGWSFVFDYRKLRPGVHTFELQAPGHEGPVRFGARRFVVLQRPDSVIAAGSVPIPASSSDTGGMRLMIDGPAPDQKVLFNPLAALWLEYRNAQVQAYYEAFAEQAAACLPKEKLFSHQITPQLNAAWDADLLAVSASQKSNPHYLPGVTLYGGAAFGDAFFRFRQAQGWGTYAVSEMHPTFPLSVAQMEDMLDRHRAAGARFVAPYYLNSLPSDFRQGGGMVGRLISPDNPDTKYGSATFYRAMQDLMQRR